MNSLLLRLASSSGRTAVARQILVVAGIAFGSALLLVAAGIATLRRSDFAISGSEGSVCDPAFLLAMLGLVASAAWLTGAVGRFAAARSNSPSLVLAGRRLEVDPHAQGRATTAVVLVVFAATIALVALAAHVDGNSGDVGFVRRSFGAVGVGMVVSLAVGAAGLLLTTTESVLDRRRTLAALHATGVPLATLRRTLLAQVALPVLPGSVLAVAAGLAFDWAYFGSDLVLSGIGSLSLLLPLVATAVAVAATCLTLPLLRSTVDVERLRTP